jgi:hypothetical protein
LNEVERITRERFETGTESSKPKDSTILTYKFEQYDIDIKLTPDGRFLGIEEVRINKDFRSYKQQTPQKIFTQVDELPPDELPAEEHSSE